MVPLLLLLACADSARPCAEPLAGVEHMVDAPSYPASAARDGSTVWVTGMEGTGQLTVTRIVDGVVDARTDPPIDISDTPLTSDPQVHVLDGEPFVTLASSVEGYGPLLGEFPLTPDLQLDHDRAWSSRWEESPHYAFCGGDVPAGSDTLVVGVASGCDGLAPFYATIPIGPGLDFPTYATLGSGIGGDVPLRITSEGGTFGWTANVSTLVFAASDLQQTSSSQLDLGSVYATDSALAVTGGGAWVFTTAEPVDGGSLLRATPFVPGDTADRVEVARTGTGVARMIAEGTDDGVLVGWTAPGKGIRLLALDADARPTTCVAWAEADYDPILVSLAEVDGTIEAIWANAEGLWRWSGAGRG